MNSLVNKIGSMAPIALLLFTFQLSQAQFTEVATGYTGSIKSILVFDANVIVGGGSNYLIKSYDIGDTLIPLTPPNSSNFYIEEMCALDSSVLFALSEEPTNFHNQIRQSVNGGMTWLTIFDTSQISLQTFKMISTSFGIGAGILGNAVFTWDSGANWTYDNLGSAYSFFCINSFNDSLVILGAEDNFLKTTDRGHSWQYSSPSLFHVTPSAIEFITKDTIISTGYFWNPYEAFISKSTDGGDSWNTKSLGINKTLSDIRFISSSEGYAVGSQYYTDSTGFILKTIDGGENWEKINTPFVCVFLKITFLNDSIALIGGTNGKLIRWNKNVFNGFEEIVLNKNDFTLIPNPATTTITITTNVATTNTAYATAQIFTIEGKPATQKIPLVNTNTVIDIAPLPKGLYFVALQSNMGYAVKKFVKE